ncbi:MAG: AIR synthase family protein [Armatimonadota bacterium]|nr:AIR synthase family protein [Armatimonadota bacterium]MDR7438348.1 AIR synthase family protein [Armatimonadota bacterium]MDR7563386.1 AIR synthase family protein [Armatimonadota bacterium]MDR7567139.1 AIR synthase family protein [Armatimonadota bacterium]MDR7601689.1 AIR synthase family protein [Armatimonadota bacterium]
MRPGKVPPELLQRLVYPYLGRRRDVLVHAGWGQDCAVLDFGEWVCVVTTDPITGATRHLGQLAVHVACNDLAATGAEPVGLLLDVLLREGSTEEDLRQLMEEAGKAVAEIGVEIVGGHTEVTPGIDRTLVVMTGIGKAPRNGYVTTSGARPGDTLLITKAAGLEGTAILATDFATYFARHLGQDLVHRAQAFLEEISVLPEGRVAVRAGAVAMHDATEGGIVGAALEMAHASGVGLELWVDRIPVREETRRICDLLGIDPLGLVSSGSLLIATQDPDRTLEALAQAGIPAAAVGLFRSGGLTQVRDGKRQELVPFARDELWRALEILEEVKT